MKNSIFLFLLMSLFCFGNTANAQDCFTSNFIGSTTQAFCSGDIPTLPNIDLAITLEGDLSTVVEGTFAWYLGTDPDVDDTYNPVAVTQIGCNSSPTFLYAFVQCDTGGNLSWVQVASYGFIVYPEPQIPVLVGPNIDVDGVCYYTIEPACPNDFLSVTDLAIFPGTLPGVLTVTVESASGPCPSIAFDLPYPSCPGNPVLCEAYAFDTLSNCVFAGTDTLLLGINADGCDDFLVITYNFLPSDTTYLTSPSCNLSGVDTIFLQNVVGCDSLVITDYISGDPIEVIQTVDTCGAVLPNDSIVLISFACDTLLIIEYNTLSPILWYEDLDGDGLGNPSVDSLSCTQPIGYVADIDMTGIQNALNFNLKEIYPNPNNGTFSIQFPNIDSKSIQLYNQTGKIITFDSETVGTNTQFNIKEANTGIYFLHFKTNDGQQHFLKVIVAKVVW